MIHSILLKPFFHDTRVEKLVRFSSDVQVAMLDENGIIIHNYIPPSTSQSSFSGNNPTHPDFYFQNVSLTDCGVSDFIMDPVLKNICDPHKKGFVRFISVKKVVNKALEEKFLKKQSDFISMGIPSEFEYGFFCLNGANSKEEYDFCRFGLKTGTSYMGEIGDPSEGICLSRYADVSSPAMFMNNQPVRILVCKVLLGRSKKVVPQANKVGWRMSPDRAFNSHVSTDTSINLPEQPPHVRYRYSQLFVYEFDRSGRTTIDRPTSVFPMAIITLDIAKPGPDLLSVMPIKAHGTTVWNGALQIQSQTVKHVTLHSHHQLMPRPRGLDTFNVPYVLPYASMMNLYPFSLLFNDEKMGLLMKYPEVCLKNQDRSECFVQYFVLKCEESEPFEDLCMLLKKESVVGYTRLENGTRAVLIPGGGLSFKLGLINYEYATIHCLFFSDRSYEYGHRRIEVSGHYIPLLDKIRPEQRIDLQDLDTLESLESFSPITTIPMAPPTSVQTYPGRPLSESPQIPEDPKLPEIQKLPELPTLLKNSQLPEVSKFAQIPKLSSIDPSSHHIKAFDLPDFSQPPPNMISSRKVLTSSVATSLPQVIGFSGRPVKRAALIPDMSASSSSSTPKVRREERDIKINAESMISQLKQTDKEHIFKDPRMEMLRKRDPEKFVEVVKEKSMRAKDHMNNHAKDKNVLLPMPSLPVAKFDGDVETNLSVSTPSKKKVDYLDQWSAPAQGQSLNANGQPGSQIKPMQLDSDALCGILGGKWFSGGQDSHDVDMRIPAGPTTSLTLTPAPLTGKSVIVIMDPELVIGNEISVYQMNDLLDASTVKNGLSSNKISIFWHLCSQEWLEIQKNNPVDKVISERSKSFLHLIKTYKTSGLVKDMERHLCDQSARSPNKYLICSMNTKRKCPESRVIFLSALIHPKFGNGPNFLANNVELITPAELIRSFKCS